MSVPELAIIGGVAGGVAFHLAAPDVLLSDAGYAFLGTVVASLVAAMASVAVTLITVRAARGARDRAEDQASDDGDDGDDPPTPIRRRRKR